MKFRWMTTIGASLAVAFGSVAGAVPASAAPISLYNTGYGYCQLTQTRVDLNPGQSATIVNACADGLKVLVIGAGITTASNTVLGQGGRITITAQAVGTQDIFFQRSSTPASSDTLVVTVHDPAVRVITQPGPHDTLQQVGVPASGDCADVPEFVGHLHGFPIGGWSLSWAEWIYDYSGGPVCTREVEERPDGTVVLIG